MTHSGKYGTQDNRDRQPNFSEMAVRCTMGSLSAMRWMAGHFRDSMSAEAASLLDAYLAEGNPEAGERWLALVREDEDQTFLAGAYGFWLCRMASFRDSESRKLLEKAPLLRKVALLDDAFQTACEDRPQWEFVDAGEMVRLGLLEFKGLDDPQLIALNRDRLYRAECYAGDSGRDETGFGMEEESNYYYFDEYFHRVHVLRGWSRLDMRNNEERIHQSCLEDRDAARVEREEYRKNHPGEEWV